MKYCLFCRESFEDEMSACPYCGDELADELPEEGCVEGPSAPARDAACETIPGEEAARLAALREMWARGRTSALAGSGRGAAGAAERAVAQREEKPI